MRAFILLLLCGAAACSRSPAAKYYLVTPREAQAVPAADGPSLGLEPVALPKYTDRPGIVTTAGPQQMRVDDVNLWAEPLSDNVTRVVAENLAAALQTDRVHLQPWPHGAVDYRVSVQIVELTGALDGDARLQALWAVYAGDEVVAARRTDLLKPAGGDYATYAAALSDLLSELCREIAAAIPHGAGG